MDYQLKSESRLDVYRVTNGVPTEIRVPTRRLPSDQWSNY